LQEIEFFNKLLDKKSDMTKKVKPESPSHIKKRIRP